MCGHSKPNVIEQVGKEALPEQDLEKVTINISSSNTASGKDSSGQSFSGTWDLYFEQALVVELSNGSRYVANVDDGTLGSSGANCRQTMVGFVQKPNGHATLNRHDIRCFYGIQGDIPLPSN